MFLGLNFSCFKFDTSVYTSELMLRVVVHSLDLNNWGCIGRYRQTKCIENCPPAQTVYTYVHLVTFRSRFPITFHGKSVVVKGSYFHIHVTVVRSSFCTTYTPHEKLTCVGVCADHFTSVLLVMLTSLIK
jgi:uncharacterized membrane protein